MTSFTHPAPVPHTTSPDPKPKPAGALSCKQKRGDLQGLSQPPGDTVRVTCGVRPGPGTQHSSLLAALGEVLGMASAQSCQHVVGAKVVVRGKRDKVGTAVG